MKNKILFKGERIEDNKYIVGYPYIDKDGKQWIITNEETDKTFHMDEVKKLGLSDELLNNIIKLMAMAIYKVDTKDKSEEWLIAHITDFIKNI